MRDTIELFDASTHLFIQSLRRLRLPFTFFMKHFLTTYSLPYTFLAWWYLAYSFCLLFSALYCSWVIETMKFSNISRGSILLAVCLKVNKHYDCSSIYVVMLIRIKLQEEQYDNIIIRGMWTNISTSVVITNLLSSRISDVFSTFSLQDLKSAHSLKFVLSDFSVSISKKSQ